MKVDIKKLAQRLANDATISDYEFWRALKTVDDQLYRIDRQHRPIPIDLVFVREIIRRARRKRLQR